ncbi:mercuric reductase [Cordyceps javanica]|uniref:Mercuric reductase n=1 Tax=Cordyceps javanica TaxID=43265 RepID=A0A545WAQ3_9HYPO|nr:mercuric reductase [Cordyceps javanica]TQW11028.1 mercuric reductase [Cordyceps javanica]
MSLPPVKPSSSQSHGADPQSSSTSGLPDSSSASAPPATDSGLPAKRGRRSNPKVKTGCTNCKKRRIKCDEKRPECTQCVRSGKACTGYPPPSRHARPVMDIRIAPKPLAAMQLAPAPPSGVAAQSQSTGISMLQKPTVLPPRRAGRRRKVEQYKALAASTVPLALHRPSMALPLQPVENMYFELFRLHTASQLSGYFNSNFWTQRVLQECHNESAIRHSVVALGALYKTLELSFEAPYGVDTKHHTDSIMAHWQIAVKQYSDACNAVLSVKGDHKQAIIQIQTGLGILGQSQGRRSSNLLTALNTTPDELVTLFGRLAIQAKSYDLAFHFPQPYIIKLGSTADHPDSPGSDASSPSAIGSPPREGIFETLAEARLASDKLCMALLMFIEQLHAAKTDPSYVLPAAWKVYGMGLKDRLTAWADAFEPILMSRHRPDMPYLERAGIAALKMFQINTHIIFLMLFCDNELQFDAFMPHFKMIVELGWEVVGADESRFAAEHHAQPPGQPHYAHGTWGAFQAGKYGAGRLKPSFSADLGIVPPLFVVATKCRDPWLRRQAIQLLKSSARREGMWDSELTSNIATWVMQLEEQGVPGGGGAAVPPAFDPRNPAAGYMDDQGVVQRTIPDDRRIMLKAADFDLRARYADIVVGTRAVYNGSLDVRLKKTRISW